ATNLASTSPDITDRYCCFHAVLSPRCEKDAHRPYSLGLHRAALCSAPGHDSRRNLATGSPSSPDFTPAMAIRLDRRTASFYNGGVRRPRTRRTASHRYTSPPESEKSLKSSLSRYSRRLLIGLPFLLLSSAQARVVAQERSFPHIVVALV